MVNRPVSQTPNITSQKPYFILKPIVNIFFELLQIAVGNRQDLTELPSEKGWLLLFELCKRHSLLGVAFAGIKDLKSAHGDDEGWLLPLVKYKQWLGVASKIQQKNLMMLDDCEKVCNELTNKGFAICIIKGQSNIANYIRKGHDEIFPNCLGMLRSAGDIDILARNKSQIDKISLPIKFCIDDSLRQGKKTHVTYHHTDLFRIFSYHNKIKSLELHYRASYLCSPIRNKRLQKWLEANMPFDKNSVQYGEIVLPTPPVSYDIIYQLLHIYKHLFESGIGLRQLMDYYFVLSRWNTENRDSIIELKHDVYKVLCGFGMGKFVSAIMWIMQKVFAMPSDLLICTPNEKEGRYLLKQILIGGNFGHYDKHLKKDKGRGTLSHAWIKSMHNIRLVFHYPEEVLWEPFFRLFHFLWRSLQLWRFE